MPLVERSAKWVLIPILSHSHVEIPIPILYPNATHFTPIPGKFSHKNSHKNSRIS